MKTQNHTQHRSRPINWMKLFGLLLLLALAAGLATPPARAQDGEVPLTPEEPRGIPAYDDSVEAATDPTNSAGIAWADPNGAHSTYPWFITFQQMGHLMESYQNYGSSASGAYFHHGIDVITTNYGVNVYAVSGGQVVNVENYNSSSLYWEVAILDAEGYVWQYHHIDQPTIPTAITNAFNAWKANPTTGGFISAGTLIGKNVQWPTYTFGYYFHHIHLNILADGDVYINPLEFFPALNDTQLPEIQQIGLLKDNTVVSGNTVSGSYGLYVKARDYILSTAYYLPPYKYEIALDGGSWETVWQFHSFPGGANDYTYVNDFYVYPPTCGNYDCRMFIVDLGFTTSGQRTFPTTPGLHQILVRVSDFYGNQAVEAYAWNVANSSENTTSGSLPDNNCSGTAFTRTFNVSASGTVTDLNLGLNITHASRGHLRISLQAPGDASPTILVNTSSDTYDNYDVLLDDASTLATSDGNNDTTTAPNYEAERFAAPGVDNSLESFYGKNAQGTWTLSICDGTSGTSGTFNKARLDLTTEPLRGSAIGNRVWLDEDADGVQDPGEAGLPNLSVDLCSDPTCSTLLRSTTSDANGLYIFKPTPGANLTAGTYSVRVTPASGMLQTYDENGALDHTSQVVLGAGQQYLSADFGYTWNGSAPAATAAAAVVAIDQPNAPDANDAVIGDRIWLDANADGLQQPNEIGLSGIGVSLVSPGADFQFDTGDDVTEQTISTGLSGQFRFSSLPAGAYRVVVSGVPSGYVQTADPDEFGAVCSTSCDHQTTTPLLLAPADVFLNADFGYQPSSGATAAIGGTLWLDSDRMNDLDASEPRLAGVSVALIQDLDGDGIWDAGEPILAAATSDSSGAYSFPAVPVADGAGSDDTLVWVSDAFNFLGELVNAFDGFDGFNQAAPAAGLRRGLGISAVTNLSPSGASNVNFAFLPFRQDPIAAATTTAGNTLDGAIGDTLWLDSNASGAFNAGEGLEGVTVHLYASGGTNLLARTVTDENGQYFFAGLNPAASYVVQVQTATLPYSGLTNFVDPDGGTANSANLTLTSGSPVNLAQDFGYRDASSPNTLSGTLWNDRDADGALDGSESAGFQGISVTLSTASGLRVASATSAANGGFSFSNLPDGTFVVRLVDPNRRLNGYWKTTGANPNADNNSQAEPYSVTVSGGQSNASADFGYYQQPAALGNKVWNDTDDDGIQDAGEPALADVPVTLSITYPDGSPTTLVTTTDANGLYRFGNLLQSQEFDGVGVSGLGGTEPQYQLSLAIPAGMIESLPNQGGNNALDSDGIKDGANVKVIVGDINNAAALLVKGAANDDYDFGFLNTPTFSFLSELPQAGGLDHAIQITWTTSDETEVISFDLYREASQAEARILVYHVQAQNQEGHAYAYLDTDVSVGLTYTYWLEVRLKDGSIARMEPVSANAKTYIYMPLTAH